MDAVPKTLTPYNMRELFSKLPDLYKYLKISFSFIESSGDVIINDILDGEIIVDSTSSEYYDPYFIYIQRTYELDYIPGGHPTPFSILGIEPYNNILTPFPRLWFWWEHDLEAHAT